MVLRLERTQKWDVRIREGTAPSATAAVSMKGGWFVCSWNGLRSWHCHILFFFLVTQTVWYGCYFFYWWQCRRTTILFCFRTSIGLENKFVQCALFGEESSTLSMSARGYEMHNIFFRSSSLADWRILFCFTFICKLGSVVQQFDWLMQLLFDMHPNVLVYCALPLLSINLSSLRYQQLQHCWNVKQCMRSVRMQKSLTKERTKGRKCKIVSRILTPLDI